MQKEKYESNKKLSVLWLNNIFWYFSSCSFAFVFSPTLNELYEPWRKIARCEFHNDTSVKEKIHDIKQNHMEEI